MQRFHPVRLPLLQDVRPWGPRGVCFWSLGRKHSHHGPNGGHFVGLWQCSSCSSSHKGADSDPAEGLRTFFCPAQLSWGNYLSPGISSILSRLCWETPRQRWRDMPEEPNSECSVWIQHHAINRNVDPTKWKTTAVKSQTTKTISQKRRGGERKNISVASTWKTNPVLVVVSLLPLWCSSWLFHQQ